MTWPVGVSLLLDAAFAYIEQSPQWPIFPVDARTKRPRIKTGRDHAEHATSTVRRAIAEGRLVVERVGAAVRISAVATITPRGTDGVLAKAERRLGLLPGGKR